MTIQSFDVELISGEEVHLPETSQDRAATDHATLNGDIITHTLTLFSTQTLLDDFNTHINILNQNSFHNELEYIYNYLLNLSAEQLTTNLYTDEKLVAFFCHEYFETRNRQPCKEEIQSTRLEHILTTWDLISHNKTVQQSLTHLNDSSFQHFSQLIKNQNFKEFEEQFAAVTNAYDSPLCKQLLILITLEYTFFTDTELQKSRIYFLYRYRVAKIT